MAELKSKQIIIGLTGGIASGKSLVAKVLSMKGYPVLDADQLSRSLTDPDKKCFRKIIKLFGKGILTEDGFIDRDLLRELVFSDPKKRRKLESILHPQIINESKRWMQRQVKSGSPLLFYEASLLIETGRYKDFDGILLIQTNRSNQVRRLKNRKPNLSNKTIQQILKAQWSNSKKAKFADWIIKNNSTTRNLKHKIDQWLENLYKNRTLK